MKTLMSVPKIGDSSILLFKKMINYLLKMRFVFRKVLTSIPMKKRVAHLSCF